MSNVTTAQPTTASARQHEERLRTGTTLWEVIRHLWPRFMLYKGKFWGTMAAVFIVSLSGRASVLLFGYAIDHGVRQSNTDILLWAAIAYFLLEVSGCTTEFLYSYLFARLGNQILFDIRQDLIRHVQSLPISFFDKNPSGRIVTRLTNDVVSLGEIFTQGLITVFVAFVSLVFIISAMLFISVKMTVVTLMIAPPLIWVIVILSQRILLTMRESKAKLAAINAFVAENIGGMRVLQLYDRVGKNSQRFQKLSGDYRQQMAKSVRQYATLWPITAFFNGASVATALYIGGRLTLDGTVSPGSMVAFILLVRSFLDPIQVFLEKYQVFQNSLSGAERIFTMLDEKSEANLGAPSNRVASTRARWLGEIEFKSVTFRYGPELNPALANVNLRIRAGESVGLVGRTGSGKSTAIALLQRLYDLSEGSIWIDGRNIADVPRRELRSRIGVVQQDTFMFRGTVAENISLGDPAITRERIVEAARGACLDEFISRHVGGLDAKVEERGANLSFGERQLIAFARILAFDPDILILDEATANIDSHTENLIQTATKKVCHGRTSLIIAHRISTIVDCDQIVLLDHGAIREIGTHAQLYRKADGLYRQLCDSQKQAGHA